jgi:hypothetical protein
MYKDRQHYTWRAFDPSILCSRGVRDDRCAASPVRAGLPLKMTYFALFVC